MESVSPNIFVKDIHKTIAFYKVLGFEVNTAVPDEENPVFVLMTCGKITFLFQTFDSIGDELPNVRRQDGGSLLLYIQLTGIRALYDKIKDKVTIYKGLEKTFYGATEFSIIDINQIRKIKFLIREIALLSSAMELRWSSSHEYIIEE